MHLVHAVRLVDTATWAVLSSHSFNSRYITDSPVLLCRASQQKDQDLCSQLSMMWFIPASYLKRPRGLDQRDTQHFYSESENMYQSRWWLVG
jgi:hypothetical protein